ncbi:DUF4422 domain-containing protein [Klebsiella sp. MISC125]|uniref:DUF4422 domain-containing protein n=1 Tax=Klebsiella sp. MISC125 TaxID=2755386 RepID=UPI003DA82542
MNDQVNIKIIIATHKRYVFPNDEIYIPLHVGKVGKEDLELKGDDTGDNISDKNPSYCELTGLYWAWKNLNYDYVGLAHYRRHFSLSIKDDKDNFKNILTSAEAIDLMSSCDILVPKKRRYYIETLYSHYKNTHYGEHLDYTRKIIEDSYPNYLQSYDVAVKKTSGYMFNMFVMRIDLLNEYCEWLFAILKELEKRVDSQGYSSFHQRFYGRVSEILFNVWLSHKRNENLDIRIKEVNYIHMENINWLKKIGAFLLAKFSNKKYESSF